jgi:hypothetical protein
MVRCTNPEVPHYATFSRPFRPKYLPQTSAYVPPMHGQEDNIKTDLKQTSYEDVDWISMAQENEAPDSIQSSKYNK